MRKKYEIYLILKKFWSEKAVRSTRLCTRGYFLEIQGRRGSLVYKALSMMKLAENNSVSVSHEKCDVKYPYVFQWRYWYEWYQKKYLNISAKMM